MSIKAEFHRAVCELANDGSPEAAAALDRILEAGRRLLILAEAERLMLDGWEKARKGVE